MYLREEKRRDGAYLGPFRHIIHVPAGVTEGHQSRGGLLREFIDNVAHLFVHHVLDLFGRVERLPVLTSRLPLLQVQGRARKQDDSLRIRLTWKHVARPAGRQIVLAPTPERHEMKRRPTSSICGLSH